MKPNKYSAFLAIFLSTTICARQRGQEWERERDWKLCELCGIPARIALNSSPGPTIMPKRNIYLFIGEANFTKENLTKTFKNLSAAYPDPSFLRIYAYSHKEYLKALIAIEEQTYSVDFDDSPKGRQAAREYYDDRYPRTGYFKAFYLRRGDEESFTYTPNPMEEQTVQVILKDGSKK